MVRQGRTIIRLIAAYAASSRRGIHGDHAETGRIAPHQGNTALTKRNPRAYILYNHYGNATSDGFANTWAAMMFDSRAERDDYVSRWQGKNISIRACTKKEAAKYAERNGNTLWLRDYDAALGDLLPGKYFEARFDR